jgi:ribose 5-phosphate isomerase RpiB
MGRMTIQIIADKVTEENKIKIIEAIKQNNISIEQNGKYNSNGLQILFNEWHRHFPHIKQQLGCIGCRKAVTKFWNNVNNIWNSNN